MSIRFSFISLLILQMFFISYAQQDVVTFEDKIDNIVLNIKLQSRPFELIGNGIKKIDFSDYKDESTPGSPVLPSKTFFVAIPPGSKVTIKSGKTETKIYNDVQPESNPDVYLKDSVMNYSNSGIDKKYYSNKIYPVSECEIAGYTWLRDYYCAVVRVNQYRYDWLNRNLIEINSVKVELSIKDVKPFAPARTQSGYFNKVLQNIIVNYKDADKYRGIRNLALDDSSGNWIDYNSEYVKLNISEDGIYKITYDDLLGYGVNPSSIDPTKVKVYKEGTEIPLFVFGESDLSFDQGDYIEFYCKKNYSGENYKEIVQTRQDYKNYLNRYSDTTIVWLNWSGNNGQRINLQNVNPSGATDTLESHIAFTHFENDMQLWYYDAVIPRVQLPFWQENKVWTWLVRNQSGSSSIIFSANNFVPDKPLKITARMISNAADNIVTNAHRFGMSLNSTSPQDTIVFDFKQTVNFSNEFSTNQLIAGDNNRIRIFGLPNDAGVFHQALIDWVDLEYESNNVAANDSLLIRVGEGYQNDLKVIKVQNITLPVSQMLVYKIKPSLKKITSFNITSSTLSFSDTISSGDEYFIVKDSASLSPLFVKKKMFENLRDLSRGADEIIISNKVLQNSVNSYHNFINQNYNLRSELIFVDDIFDEFSYGYNKPEAIKSFLEYANSNWIAPSPSSLLLLGDANYDYKKKLNPPPIVERKNLVPSYGFPVSDNWFTMWDTTNVNLPQMFVGRIPAETNEDVLRYLDKHQKYISRRYDEFNKQFVFFSGGDPADTLQLSQLKSANDFIKNNYITPAPVGGNGIHFYKTVNPSTNFGPYTLEQIENVLDSGALFISYIGHSGTETWDNGITDVSDLKNIFDDRLPLISDFGCSTGKFAEPDVDAFGELFVTSSVDGQAISYLGNSSWGYISSSVTFPKLFYKKLLVDSFLVTSQAHFEAKIELLDVNGLSDVNKVFNYCNIFFGDPLISFALPTKPNFAVNSNSFSIAGSNPLDVDDSVTILINISNLGKVPEDSVMISLTDIYLGTESFTEEIRIPSLLFKQQLAVTLPVNGQVGEHTFKAEIDKDNLIDEMYEDDNEAQFTYLVYSTSVRPLEAENFYNPLLDSLRFLNPVLAADNSVSSFIVEIADKENFSNASQFNVDLDLVHSSFPLQLTQLNKRYWWRVKLNSSQATWSEAYSLFNKQSNLNWLFDNSFSTNDVEAMHVSYDSTTGSWKLIRQNNILVITSAGSDDGEFGSIKFNYNEILPNTFYWGIATAIIDSITLEPSDIKYFTFYDPEPGADTLLINYIDSLPSGTLLAMTVCTDAAQSVLGFSHGTPVRLAIETLGSLYIDSVLYRDSWCMIGKKGASQGSVPESFKKRFYGRASLDTTLFVVNEEGWVRFPGIKNSSEWQYVSKTDSLPDGSSVEYYPIGIKEDNTIDTLSAFNFIGDTADLSGISANTYPEIELFAKLHANTLKESPRIKSIGVKYIPLPELAVNYQVVSASADSVTVGENIDLNFSVYNVGETKADSFRVTVDVINDDNSRENIFTQKLDSLSSGSKSVFNLSYNTSSGNGSKSFLITIDPLNTVREMFEDNNFFTVPFFIKADTTTPVLNLTIDGNDILDGEYISSAPDIHIELNDYSLLPVTDPNSVLIFLDDDEIPNDTSIINYNFSTKNPKVVVDFKPVLEDGEYTLKVLWRNTNGNIVDSSGVKRSFLVSSEMKIMNVYNYPNPTRGETHFTFKLTQIPEEIKIKIFTIAGRLIREIQLFPTDLRYDFNKIYWDGKDQDGDEISNGVYLYKVIMKAGDKTQAVTEKLAVVR